MPRHLLILPMLLSACSGQISGVQTFSYAGGDVRGGLISYDHSPPAGGPYAPLWQTCGVYTAPIYPEYAVHSLARGAVWLTYRPDLGPDDLATLQAALDQQPSVLLSPLDGQVAAVVATAWNAQLEAPGVNDSRLRRFVQRYTNTKSVPEAGQACTGGYAGTQ
ncbi:DUF3105 domain-containing protein [Deinococcus rubellus]|uniref:DUF3105 domain-containing protein n=1 Tax=Deinococcus rubellus TaxID=1889240 RepID=A0ABY5YHB2_9DEIO|nr:DUF3105 domain-containing protein [Deinococcus rubellus]UWX64316.1 DUF3105 domain-containing protein [Deinococcus rubellus]